MLKQGILPILQREAHPVLEVFMRSDDTYLLGSSLNLFVSHYSEIQCHIERRPWEDTLICLFSGDTSEIHDNYGI